MVFSRPRQHTRDIVGAPAGVDVAGEHVPVFVAGARRDLGRAVPVTGPLCRVPTRSAASEVSVATAPLLLKPLSADDDLLTPGFAVALTSALGQPSDT